jgi:hypothetical protein
MPVIEDALGVVNHDIPESSLRYSSVIPNVASTNNGALQRGVLPVASFA